MANQIQIKRSTTNANPTGLANGELAYRSNGDVFFIGSPNGSVVAIGGARFPGTLTANQALVANATGFLDQIKVVTANISALYANGSVGTSGQVLTSNGANLYWSTPAAGVSGSNTQIQFNDSGTLNAAAGFTFNKTTNTVSIGSGTVNATNYSGTANNANNLGGAAASVYGDPSSEPSSPSNKETHEGHDNRMYLEVGESLVILMTVSCDLNQRHLTSAQAL